MEGVDWNIDFEMKKRLLQEGSSLSKEILESLCKTSEKLNPMEQELEGPAFDPKQMQTEKTYNMEAQKIRLQCLEKAIEVSDTTGIPIPEDIVAAAEKFYEFVAGTKTYQ